MADLAHRSLLSVAGPGGPSKHRWILLSTRSSSFSTSHSQKRRTLHPWASRVRLFLASRALFFSILALQKEAFTAGIVKCRGHPCQKQPSTKTRTLLRTNAMSGLAPSILVPILYRKPIRHRALRSRSSGAVSRVRTERMISLRFSLVNWSTRYARSRPSPRRGGQVIILDPCRVDGYMSSCAGLRKWSSLTGWHSAPGLPAAAATAPFAPR
jgi:hypothetical protein